MHRYQALQDVEQRAAADKKKALDDLYNDVQQRFTHQLNAQLAEQRQSLVTQATREKVSSLFNLRSKNISR